MSLNTRNVTQGGQVFKYMVGMFLQINNLIVYWILLLSVLIFITWLCIQMSFEHLIHGSAYWLIKHFITPFKFLPQKNPYTFHWTHPRTGEIIELKRTATEVLQDKYFIATGQLLKETAFWGWGIATISFVVGIITVYWFLGNKGAKQRKNDIIGGRYHKNLIIIKEISNFIYL